MYCTLIKLVNCVSDISLNMCTHVSDSKLVRVCNQTFLPDFENVNNSVRFVMSFTLTHCLSMEFFKIESEKRLQYEIYNFPVDV